jgi:glycosyltransferase involved in cell wall biosynthesis
LAGQLACLDRKRQYHCIASHCRPANPAPNVPDDVLVRSFEDDTRKPRHRGIRHEQWLSEVLEETSADVLHARGLWMLADARRAVLRSIDVPMVAGFHGFDDASKDVSWLRRRQWRYLLNRCDAIITVSYAARDSLTDALKLDADRIRVIYNGVDTDLFRPPTDRPFARESLGINDDKPLLLCVGSYMPVKGYDVLLNALRGGVRENGAFRGVHVLFVGQDRLKGSLQRQAASLKKDLNIRFVGSVDDVRPYYEAADALIVPSRSEGFSNVVLEAMACSLPVVATRVGGNPEQVIDEHTGWLVAPNSPKSLGKAIIKLMCDPHEARERGANGRRRAIEMFALQDAAEQYEQLYEDLIG